MKRLTMLWAACVGCLTLAVAGGSAGVAGDEATNAVVNGIADLLQKGDAAGAKKAAVAFAGKNDCDMELVMSGMKLRTKKGIGVGDKPNAIQPDGIELKFDAIARDGITPAAIKKEGPALSRAGYVAAAIAHVAHAKPPEKFIGKQKKEAWLEWSQKMILLTSDFAVAANAGNAADLKKSAVKIKQNCDSCHLAFKQ